MADINHFAISSILNSEIVGRSKFGHGQINSLGDAQRYIELLGITESPAVLHATEEVPVDKVREAFLAVRSDLNDRGAPDLYVADSERNARFLAKCRELGVHGSDYVINKKLLYARKLGHLTGLKSVRTSFNCEDYSFAVEFAATELKYKTGASIDDILCDPGLASKFDAIARKLAPGFASLQYRWAILSVRKAGRKAEWKPEYEMPELTGQFRLTDDPLEVLPHSGGIYLLSEKNKPLYARSTENLRHGVELHRHPQALSAITDVFWRPKLYEFVVSYAVLQSTKLLRAVERRIIEERKPVFNVSRVA